MKIIAFLLFAISQIAFAQTWSKFTYFGDSEKYNFDIEETTIRNVNDILTLWVRVRPKEVNPTHYATLDKVNIRCTDYQYSVSTRKTVDKDGRTIKEVFDNADNSLKWSNTADNSVGRRLATKYCKLNNQNVRTTISEDNWLSLGRNEADEFTYFVDPTKNKIIGDELIYTGRIIYSAEQKNSSGKLFKTIINENVVNCRNSTYATIKTEVFSSNNVLIDSNSISKEFSNFQYIAPSSFAGRIREKYCDPSLLAAYKNLEDSKNKNSIDRSVNNFTTKLNEDKCEKLGFKKSTPAFERCLKQLDESK